MSNETSIGEPKNSADPDQNEEIEIKMTWSNQIGILCTLLQDGNAKGKQEARSELYRLAKGADEALARIERLTAEVARLETIIAERGKGKVVGIDDLPSPRSTPATLITKGGK